MNKKCLPLFPLAALVLTLSGCFDGNNNNDGSGTPSGSAGAPALAFTAPESTYDLANYYQAGRYSLPVGSGANLLAAEASGVTFNQTTGTLFVIGDGGTSIVQVTKQGSLIDSMTLAADAGAPAGTHFYDTEGISWISGNKFVMVEERYRQVDQFHYVPGVTLDGSGAQAVKLGTTIGNIGLEGISYDPMTGGFILAKETSPIGLFQTGIDFTAGTATNGSPTTDESTNLFDPNKTGLSTHNDVFALSNILPSSAPDYDNLAVISAPDGSIVKVDRAGNVLSTLAINPHAQDEGMTMDPEGNLYAVGETGGGIGHPEMVVYTPTRDKSAVGSASNLYLTFEQNTIPGSGYIVLSNGAGGDVRHIAVSDTAQVSFNGKVVKINPATDLAPGEQYSITYAAGVFRKASGAADVPAVSDASALSFTTVGESDHTAPQLFSTTPVSDANGIAADAPIALNFSEAVRAGTGNVVVANASGSDTRTISITDTTQVRFSGPSMIITPNPTLQASTTYSVQVASGAVLDTAGNAFAGITSPTDFRFTTAAPQVVLTTVLITEVNSNAAGGDFYELYNYGDAPVDMSNWKWSDSSHTFSDTDPSNTATFASNTVIPAHARAVVVNTANAAAFRTTWGLADSVQVIADSGPGLGGGDAVVVYDPSGNVVTAFNYGTAAVPGTITGGAPIPPAVASSGVTANLGTHAGPAFGGSGNSVSAVWDGLSTSSPTYKAASLTDGTSFAEPNDPTAIGSPGL